MSRIKNCVPALCLLLCVGIGWNVLGTSAERASAEGMPLIRAKLKNTAPPGSPPATATVERKSPAPVGPVQPGQEGETTMDGDAVTVTVTVEGAPPLTGSGEYPGSFISSVEIETDGTTGTAVVKFHSGQPEQTIPLTP